MWRKLNTEYGYEILLPVVYGRRYYTCMYSYTETDQYFQFSYVHTVCTTAPGTGTRFFLQLCWVSLLASCLASSQRLNTLRRDRTAKRGPRHPWQARLQQTWPWQARPWQARPRQARPWQARLPRRSRLQEMVAEQADFAAAFPQLSLVCTTYRSLPVRLRLMSAADLQR